MLDILFLIPGHQSGAYQKEEHATEPPAKARFMASYLLRRNVGLEVWDTNITEKLPGVVAADVCAAAPRLVVMPVYGLNPSSSTQTMPSARLYAQAIKDVNPNMPILFSGTHPAALPEQTLREEPIDYVCDGEGPITVHELLQALTAGDGVENVRSLWHRKDGGIVKNTAAPLVVLDDEPAIDGWRFMDPRKYFAHDWHSHYINRALRTPYANPYSVEGCPFSCDFCNIQSTFRAGERLAQPSGASTRNSYRLFNSELFVQEVEHLVTKYGVKHFKIPDEMFALNARHVLGIAKGIKERFGDKLNFWSYSRIDTWKPQFLEPMHDAGMKWICLGIEAANSKVRAGQDKKFGDEHIHKIVSSIYGAGMHAALNYIFGLPGETQESMQATLDLAIELNSHYASFYLAMAMPGSELHRVARANGYPLPERPGGPGWAGYAQYSYVSEPYIEGSALTPADVVRFRDAAFIKYYSRPEYRAKLLADPDFGEAAVANIDRMLKRPPLRRKLLGD